MKGKTVRLNGKKHLNSLNRFIKLNVYHKVRGITLHCLFLKFFLKIECQSWVCGLSMRAAYTQVFTVFQNMFGSNVF